MLQLTQRFSKCSLIIEHFSEKVISRSSRHLIHPCLGIPQLRNLHITSPCTKEIKMGHIKVAIGKMNLDYKNDSVDGEKWAHLDTLTVKKEDIFPDENTPNKMFNGVAFKDLPIANIKATQNNTIINFTDATGTVIALNTSGIEGFKNARKGTNVAAQQAALTIGRNVSNMGYTMVRVRVQGIGPGRLSAIKGLQMGGLDIISITDTTRVTWNPLRPRKPRRL